MPIHPIMATEAAMCRSNTFVIAVLCAVAFGVSSCGLFEQQPATVPEYLAWLGDQDNGVSQTVSANGVHIRVTYLPPEYMAYREMSSRDAVLPTTKDSLLAMYEHSRAFLFEFAPDTSKGKGDVLYKDVYTYGDYTTRVKTMNFSLGEYVVLESNGKKCQPAFSFFENSYSLDNRRKAVVLFTPSKGDAPLSNDAAIVFYDEIFQTGIHRFSFEQSDMQRIPSFPFAALAQNL